MEVNKPEWNKKMKLTKTNPLLTRNCINCSALRRGFFLITLTWFALSPTVHAVTPAPDGGYPNARTGRATPPSKTFQGRRGSIVLFSFWVAPDDQ